MTLITSSIPNLINGVSQQPATLRLASQAEEQVNFLSSVSDGLKRRPGTRHVAKIATTALSDAFIHAINRDASERYIVAVTATGVRVFDTLTGLEKTVNAPSGVSYLTGGTKTSFRAVTVADYTFIVNNTKTVLMDTATTPARPNNGLVIIRAGNYGKRYQVSINGVQYAVELTPNGSDPSHAADIRTGAIALNLYNKLVASAAPAAGFSFTLSGDVITVTRVTATPFSLDVNDDAGGINAYAVVSKVQRFSDLPRTAPNGFSVEVTGDNTSQFDNYHVTFTSEGTSGVWKETAKAGETFKLNPLTMPHVLVREANGTFTFKPATWVDRKVGDKERVGDPSFTGRKITDIFFYRDRLGVLSDENVILTKQGEFFDFFRDTATTLLATDPIDLAVTNSRVSFLNHALPFSQSLMLCASGGQFMLRSGEILSAETAYIGQATEFNMTEGVRPVGVGQFVYFAVPKGTFSGVREYFVSDGGDQTEAIDVTSHCPRYLPDGIFKLAASTSEDMLVALSSKSPSSLWVYKFYFGESGKLQSAWSEWRFGADDTILSVEFIESAMFLVISRSDGTYLERINIESGAVEAGASLPYHVDRGLFLTGGVYDAVNNWTTFTLPYATSSDMWVFAGGGDAVLPETANLTFTRPTTTTVRVTGGNFVGRTLYCGVRFTSRYTFSTFYLRTQDAGGGVLAMDDGRVQVRRMFLSFAESGFFRSISKPTGRDASIRDYTGRRLADASATLGGIELSDGRFSFPVMCRNKDANITIESDHFLPCAFTSAEWEGTYHTRARRV